MESGASWNAWPVLISPNSPSSSSCRGHPEWKRLPAAVVAQDKPQGEILMVSPEARAAGVLPGMRYAAALSLAADLRAAEVSAGEVQIDVEELAGCFGAFPRKWKSPAKSRGYSGSMRPVSGPLFLARPLGPRDPRGADRQEASRLGGSGVPPLRRLCRGRGREGVLVLAGP